MIVVAHLSDIHIDAGQRSVDRARAVMDYLEHLPHDLDAVVVTGDIADHGLPDEYETAAQLLTSRHPVLVCPGNHDARAPFRRHLLGVPPSDEPVNTLYRGSGFTIALCDSSIPGRDDGRLDDSTIAWLDGGLEEVPADEPVLVGFHHPPAELHEPFVDSIRQFDTEPLAALVKRRPNIVALLCGHAHTAAATSFADRPMLVAPGVVSTLRLPWERATAETPLASHDDPPSLSFHVLADGRITTHHRSVMTNLPVPRERES
ncbi:metallophosphoesterase [Nocardioides speluncae]|uniref:metallophosphoesterase n=1 Tax=Nocardioides speluncae TaxID=2670337 RepID=UPI000D691390|nr:metallophosphoesterase [Nocardioides speluncae]